MMGHELWTSPVTGYRRNGTRLQDIRALMNQGITARAIFEPLQSCEAASLGYVAKQVLERRGFDVAGVVETSEQSPKMWVLADNLGGGYVKDVAQPFLVEQLISDAAPLAVVLRILKDRPYVFVLAGTDIAGIISRADLNKPPVRLYLFGMISLLEMHLAFWIKTTFPRETWRQRLKAPRIEAAKALQNNRRKMKQDPFLLECLQFCDKRDLVTGRKNLRDALSLGSQSSADKTLKRVEKLRNVLAHSQDDLAEGSTWAETISLMSWIERVLEASDEKVEQKAHEIANP